MNSWSDAEKTDFIDGSVITDFWLTDGLSLIRGYDFVSFFVEILRSSIITPSSVSAPPGGAVVSPSAII